VIDSEIGSLLEGAVMMVVATSDASLRPSIARAVGARRIDDGVLLDIYLSSAQWPTAVANCTPGAPIAFTFCRPTDYRTYQIKGRVIETVHAAASHREDAADYIAGVATVLFGLGVTRQQFAHWITAENLVRIRVKPRDLFQQTPGPGAGQRLGGLPA
jgi:hypothetical protein